MRFRSPSLLLAAGLALTAGCGSLQLVGAPAGPADDGMVTATARFSAARRVQDTSPCSPWRKADIDHVRVSLYRGTNTPAVFIMDVPQSGLDAGVVRFSNLRKNTAYRVVLTAWSDVDEQSRIDNADVDEDSCTTSFETTEAPSVDAGTLKLKLRDRDVDSLCEPL